MENILVPLIAIATLFLGLPWLVFHYITKWKQAPRITQEDERLLDEMHMLARRLEERLNTVERIVAADNPDFRPGLTTAQPEWKPGLSAPTADWPQGRPAPQSPYQIDRRN